MPAIPAIHPRRRPGRPRGHDPRHPARREQILEAACQAILDRGFPATRITDIAAAAGTSTGTIHYYFETKDEVLVAALKWAGELTPVADPDVVADRLIAMVDGLGFETALGYSWTSPDRMHDRLFDFAAEQLGVPRGMLEGA